MLRAASAESLDVDDRCVSQLPSAARAGSIVEHNTDPASDSEADDAGLECDGRVTAAMAPVGGKRRRYSSSSDDASQSGVPPPAPATLPCLMDWASQYIAELHNKRLSQILVENLAGRVNLFSDYSGMGSLEQVARHIH